MTSALEDGLISGFEDGTIRPDSSLTAAQAATLLCRALDAQGSSDIAVLGLTGDEWYADTAGKALYLGLISPGDDLAAPITRHKAFIMATEAFQLAGSNVDPTSLSTFSDSSSLSGGEKNAVAGLVNEGLVQGYGGSLNLSGKISRAEFVSLLYRIINTGVISAKNSVSELNCNTLWLSCSTENARFSNVTANRVVIRSNITGTINLRDCDIGELVLAGGGDISLSPRGLEIIRIGPGSGRISLTDKLNTLDVTGSGRKIILSNDVKSILVSGDGNDITLSSGAHADSITVTGIGNTFAIHGVVNNIRILGEKTVLTGYGSIADVYLRAPDCEITNRVKNLTDETDYGLYGVGAELEYPELLPAGGTLIVTARLLNAPAGLNCREAWYIDGELVFEQLATLTGNDEFTLKHDYSYKRGMAVQSKIEFRLEYITKYGYPTSVSAKANIKLENYSEDQLYASESQRVLSIVTADYAGDFTLAWAQEHDYTKEEKEMWVNAKGYSSDSRYLIWVNQTYQRVNIFDGSSGSWQLVRDCIVGCGRGNNTPKGVFKTTWNQPGWYTSTYEVRPVVRFLGGGYAFHSRLYIPGSDNELMDPSIGYPVSHGCIRMYDEDIWWIYNNVPSGTTVVVN